MLPDKKFCWTDRGRSFKYAWQGIRTLIVCEHNARIHLAVTVLVIFAGFIFSISAVEWCLVALCIGGVFFAEAVNSAVEALADKVSIEKHPLIGKAKDLAAGAVLLFVCGAVTVGLIIFIPKLLSLIN